MALDRAALERFLLIQQANLKRLALLEEDAAVRLQKIYSQFSEELIRMVGQGIAPEQMEQAGLLRCRDDGSLA